MWQIPCPPAPARFCNHQICDIRNANAILTRCPTFFLLSLKWFSTNCSVFHGSHATSIVDAS